MYEQGFILVRGRDHHVYALNDGYYIYPVSSKGELGSSYGYFLMEGSEIPRADRLLAQKLLLETCPIHTWGYACRGLGDARALASRVQVYYRWFVKTNPPPPPRLWRRLINQILY